MNDARIELRLDAEQKAEIERTAQALDISASEWIRSTLSRALKSTLPASVQGSAATKTAPRLEPMPSTNDHLGPPAPNSGEPPCDYEIRVIKWRDEQPNRDLACNAAEVLLQNYRARWRP